MPPHGLPWWETGTELLRFWRSRLDPRGSPAWGCRVAEVLACPREMWRAGRVGVSAGTGPWSG